MTGALVRPSPRPTRLVVLAVTLVVAAAATVQAQTSPVPADAPARATVVDDHPNGDDRVERSSPDDAPTGAAGDGTADLAATSFAAADAGTVSYRVVDGRFDLLAATPGAGWAVKVQSAGGVELDLDFLRGTTRVQVDVEHEDGGIRERVRVRDDGGDHEDRS